MIPSPLSLTLSPRPWGRGNDRQLDDDVAWADHAEILPGAALQGSGIAAQALDAAVELLDAAAGVLDAGLEELFALAGGGEVVVAPPGRDAEDRDEEKEAQSRHRAEGIGPGGRGGLDHVDQRGNAAAPG